MELPIENFDLKRTELEVWIDMTPAEKFSKTDIVINPNINEYGIFDEWNDWLKNPVNYKEIMYILEKKSKINGKDNNWSCGTMGSRWCDTKINNNYVRLCFYSRSYNPQMFSSFVKGGHSLREYLILIDPCEIEIKSISANEINKRNAERRGIKSPAEERIKRESEVAANNAEVEIYDWIDAKVEISRASKVEKRPAAQKKGSKGLMVSNKEAVREWDLLYGRTHEHNGLPKGDKKKK